VLGNVYEKDLGLVRQGARAVVKTSSYPKEIKAIIQPFMLSKVVDDER